MPHTDESYRYDYSRANYRRKTFYTVETVVNEAAGMLRKGFRSRTITNPRDQYGWREPSPYNANKEESTLGLFESRCKRTDTGGGPKTYTSIFQKYLGCNGNPSDLDFISADEPTQRALLKIGDAKSNLPVGIAERQKTVDLVTDSFRKLTTFLEAAATPRGRKRLLGLLRKEKRKLPKGGKGVTDAYLAYRYGIVPTMLDIQGLASAAEEAFVVKPTHLTGRASKKTAVNSKVKGTWTPGDGIIYDTETVGNGESGAKVRIDAVVYFQPFRTLERTGVVNLPNVAWELIPYSFVVDWALGVGDWLQGMTALDGLEHVRVITTRYAKVSSTTRVLAPLDRSTVTWDGWRDTWSVYVQAPQLSQFRFERVVTSGSPSSKLLWKNPISLDHFADASALLVGALGIGGKKAPRPPATRLVRRTSFPKVSL